MNKANHRIPEARRCGWMARPDPGWVELGVDCWGPGTEEINCEAEIGNIERQHFYTYAHNIKLNQCQRHYYHISTYKY